jgi:hypothetical protein
MRTLGWPVLPAACVISFGSVLCAQTPATGGQSQESVRREIDELKARLEQQEAELRAMKASAAGSSNTMLPREGSPAYLTSHQADPRTTDGIKSILGERLRIGGEIAVEFYDRNNPFGPNTPAIPLPTNAPPFATAGGDAGATSFRLRRLDLRLGVDIMEDFAAETTVRFDPVVGDQDEGSVDVKEAYIRFGNFSRHLFGFEDPSHTFIKMGTFYRWQRKKFDRGATEARSLSATQYWMDEVTGLEVGGAFDFGFFYNASVVNGTTLGIRDAGAGATNEFGGGPLTQAVFQDQEQLGDGNNNKEFEGALGFQVKMDDPRVGFGIAGFYRLAKLTPADQATLGNYSAVVAPFTTFEQDRLGALANFSFESAVADFGLQGDYVYANDSQLARHSWSLGPWAKVKFDGARYGGRLFFTGLGVNYTFSRLQVESGGVAPQQSSPNRLLGLPYEDRDMHTIGVTLEITENVDMLTELSLFNEKNMDLANNEWLVQWRVRF